MVKKNKKPKAESNASALQYISEQISGTGGVIDKKFPAIETIKYTKRFRKFLAAKNISFKVGHGVIHGLIGPNGSGKTTIMKALIGAYIPTSGELLVNGKKAGSIPANKLIGYIPEKASFPNHLNSLQYLQSMGELSGLTNKEAKSRSKDILSALGLFDHAKRKPISFSSGMQKKILLAQSLLTDPKILILDEPAANLDPTARKELFDQLIMLRDQGKTILISSHILAELERLVSEVTFVYFGDIIYSGSTSSFNKGKSSVFIKSSNNKLLREILSAKKYKLSGDLLTEIEVQDLERKEVDTLFQMLSKSKLSILSFRSNDLQSIYDRLVKDSEMNRRGSQEVNNQKALAMNTSDQVKSKQKRIEKPSSKKGAK